MGVLSVALAPTTAPNTLALSDLTIKVSGKGTGSVDIHIHF